MRRILAVLLLSAVAAGVAPRASASGEPWRGDRHAMPSAYSWLADDQPSDTYTITIVRGLKVGEVLRALGGVKEDLGGKKPGAAANYVIDHLDKYYDGPDVVQVDRLGPAVVVYEPYNYGVPERLDRLSTRGVVASFSTDVEQDTYVMVARHTDVIRTFDAGFRPPKRGALPEEAGLDWGSRHGNIYATAWSFDERITRIHIAQDWFEGTHHTYVLR